MKFGIINLVTVIIIAGIFFVLTHLGIISEPSKVITDEDLKRPIILFFLMVVRNPFLEEILSRFLPIKGVKLITDNKNILWTTIILMSILFGSVHGSWHHIFIQGASGVIYSLAFLRGGLTSSITAHAFTNFVFWSLILITG
ncbi:MAG: CPBP family intramembrane metalloprotease [Candidatus Yanofskybacteria bacterium]|nr:CPBP family intramembrane metalloprotease [Candidatus Yanofskybacteria bacterium]